MVKFGVYFGLAMVVVVMVFVQNVSASPYSRVKRVSDQRLAELETLVGLSKLSGKLITVPVGYGKVNPKNIGRKRRSQQHLLDALFAAGSSDEDDERGGPDPPNYEYVYSR